MSSANKQTGINPEEAAKIVGCSAYTIKEMARRKMIPFYKVGKKYMFTRSGLERWIQEQENKNYINEEI